MIVITFLIQISSLSQKYDFFWYKIFLLEQTLNSTNSDYSNSNTNIEHEIKKQKKQHYFVNGLARYVCLAFSSTNRILTAFRLLAFYVPHKMHNEMIVSLPKYIRNLFDCYLRLMPRQFTRFALDFPRFTELESDKMSHIRLKERNQ